METKVPEKKEPIVEPIVEKEKEIKEQKEEKEV